MSIQCYQRKNRLMWIASERYVASENKAKFFCCTCCNRKQGERISLLSVTASNSPKIYLLRFFFLITNFISGQCNVFFKLLQLMQFTLYKLVLVDHVETNFFSRGQRRKCHTLFSSKLISVAKYINLCHLVIWNFTLYLNFKPLCVSLVPKGALRALIWGD